MSERRKWLGKRLPQPPARRGRRPSLRAHLRPLQGRRRRWQPPLPLHSRAEQDPYTAGDGCAFPDGQPAGDALRNTSNGDPHANDANRDPGTWDGGSPDAHTDAHSHTHADSNRAAHADADYNRRTYLDADADGDGDCNAHAHPHPNAHAHPHPNAHTHPHTAADLHGDGLLFANLTSTDITAAHAHPATVPRTGHADACPTDG